MPIEKYSKGKWLVLTMLLVSVCVLVPVGVVSSIAHHIHNYPMRPMFVAGQLPWPFYAWRLIIKGAILYATWHYGRKGFRFLRRRAPF